MHRIEFQSAYILHTRPYQETSLLLEAFTPDFGRISLIAKGAKRPKAHNRGALQPFVPLLISCVGRGELLTLKNFDSQTPHHLIGQRLISGFYLNELLMRLIHRFDPHSELFLTYRETLLKLEQGYPEEETLRLFEKKLLETMGYALQLTKDAETGSAVEPHQLYSFDPERGPTLIQQISSSKMHLSIFKGKSLLDFAEGKLTEISTLNDIKRLMRHALSIHLGSKPLETRRLFT